MVIGVGATSLTSLGTISVGAEEDDLREDMLEFSTTSEIKGELGPSSQSIMSSSALLRAWVGVVARDVDLEGVRCMGGGDLTLRMFTLDADNGVAMFDILWQLEV